MREGSPKPDYRICAVRPRRSSTRVTTGGPLSVVHQHGKRRPVRAPKLLVHVVQVDLDRPLRGCPRGRPGQDLFHVGHRGCASGRTAPANSLTPSRACQSPIEMSLALPIRDVTRGQGIALCLPFETLALSSAAELVGVARPRCGGSVTRESDISNGENGDISIGGLHAPFA